MTITATSLTSGTAGSGGFVATADTASISPTANRLVLMAVWQAAFQPDQIDPPTSVAGAGLTFTRIGFVSNTTTGLCLSIWRALSASPSSGAVTITLDETGYYIAWSVVELDGIDTGGTNGSSAIVQSATSSTGTSTGTSSAVTLSAFGNAANGAFFANGWTVAASGAVSCSEDTGWTEIHDTSTLYGGGTARAAIETQFRADNDTTATGTWSASGYVYSMALEIKAAGSSATTVSPAQAALSLQGLASGSVTALTPAPAALSLSGKLPGTSAFTNVRIREVLVNGSGQLVGNATDIGLRVWYSGICAGPPDVSLNGMTTDANGTTSWSIATGTLAYNQAIFYVAQNSVSYSHYACGRMIPSYE